MIKFLDAVGFNLSSFFISVRCFFQYNTIELLIYSDVYLQQTFVFKAISKQLNVLVGCNLTYTKSLSTSYFEMDG